MENKDKMSFEDKLARLEEIVNKIESGSCSLEESLKLYEEGNKLIKELNSQLDGAKEKMRKYTTIED